MTMIKSHSLKISRLLLKRTAQINTNILIKQISSKESSSEKIGKKKQIYRKTLCLTSQITTKILQSSVGESWTKRALSREYYCKNYYQQYLI